MPKLTLDEIYELFEDKMKMIEEQTGSHPKGKFTLMGGPEFADNTYNQMRAVFLSGYAEGMKYGL